MFIVGSSLYARLQDHTLSNDAAEGGVSSLMHVPLCTFITQR
jgi:hypothetical protein